MAKRETLEQKKARLNKSAVYRKVLANLKEIKEVKSLVANKINSIEKELDKRLAELKECDKEWKRQSQFKTAVEVGDEVTMEVLDVDSGDGEGEMGGEDTGFDEGGPDEVVEMDKQMKKLQARIERLKKNKK
jgi:hypothetical protein